MAEICNMLLGSLSLYKTDSLELTATIHQHADLVERCKQGDSRTYKELYNHYSKAMFNTSLRILNNAAEAEDVLQEAFLDAFRNIQSFQNRSSFGAWLKQIVVNKSINQLKKKKIDFIEMEKAGVEEWTEDDGPDEKDTQMQVNKVIKAIQLLPHGYRTVLTLYLLEGYDHEEISEILGVAESTTRTQYIRAKQKLLTLLKNGG